MGPGFETAASLQCRVKSLEARVRAFESGEKYAAMREAFKSLLAAERRAKRNLERELAGSRSAVVTARNNWMQVFDDIEKEHSKAMAKKDAEIARLEKKLAAARQENAGLRAKLREKAAELYGVRTELEDAEERNRKLKAQINRDHENSSSPSSMKPGRKKIQNNREKSGRRPGGQPGHKGHGRKRLEPSERVEIPAAAEHEGNPRYRPTGRTVSRQVVDIRVEARVVEYVTPEFLDSKTGRRVHAAFPEGVDNDVCYGGGVKAFAFLLNTCCHVSIDKTRGLISEMTGGAVNLSKGMVNGLCRAFSGKTEGERKKLFADLLLSPVMGADFTNARVDGGKAYVHVCAAPGKALYSAREHKGKDGVGGTPVEEYQGVLVHDHDLTYYNYGGGHQECMAHILRYLKDSMENEPGLTWSGLMRELLREMIHCRNGIPPDGSLPAETAAGFRDRYKEILAVAKEEYEYEPPGKYYRDGYNLWKRLGKFMDACLLFLYDMGVPSDNNLCERLLREFKRKQKQMMAARSFEALGHLCDCMSVVASLRSEGANLFASVSEIFNAV